MVWISFLFFTALLSACASTQTIPTVSLKDKNFIVEIADQPAAQELGLMYRHELADDHGMLFIFNDTKPQSFWMKNCFISLDILFFDAQGRFINGHYRVPPCRTEECPIYESAQPAKYVLELKGGVGDALQLQPLDVLKLP